MATELTATSKGMWLTLAFSVIAIFFSLLIGTRMFEKERSYLCPAPGVLLLNSTAFTLTLARTPGEWEQGLSGKEKLKENEGMLFVFPDSAVREFWMKDMNFALDIIWIDSAWKVLDTAENATPESYPNIFRSPDGVKYVLEVNAGTAEHLRVFPGSILTPSECGEQ